MEEDTPILDLFEIGVGKSNRPTELIFVERCLNLLKPGGRMGIVLPDGNLNNPSLAWLRRYAEGRARLLAIVSLPEETFRSSDASVKASLVFLVKFTEADAAAWEAAWTRAQQELDPVFDAQRGELHTTYGPRIVAGEDKATEKLVMKLGQLGIERVLPAWFKGEPPAYPRMTGPTQQPKPVWCGAAATKDKDRAAKLKRDAQAALATVAKASDGALSELKAKYRAIDDAHSAALWVRVRELFDYPVFVAAPKAVGITSTGGTGEGVDNDLAVVLEQFREFERWLTKGAHPENQPNFSEPSAA
jgi:type I restriction enzyme M protein